MSIRQLPIAGLLLVAFAGSALAKRPAAPRPASPTTPEISLSDVKATPEMWFYLQERQRHDNPKNAVRHNAELDAARRSDRIAAKQWMGVSPERPTAYASPFCGWYPGTFPYGGADRWTYAFSIRPDRSADQSPAR